MKLKKENNLINTGIDLPLMEDFYTVQGEGFHQGKAAYFIRLGGCDVGCHWCDVKESWDADLHPPTNIDDIVKNTIEKQSKIVVITGGEPTMYELQPLTEKLKFNGFQTHIETSGAYPLTGIWDWVCLSPKKRKLPTVEAYRQANELKVVIYNKHDFEFAEEQAKKVSEDCLLYLQPEWSVREKMTPLIVDYILKNKKWTITLQVHKYLNVR